MNLKKITLAVLALALCLSLLTACGGGEPQQSQAPAANSGETEYAVTVVDAKGDPYTSGVIVRFLKDGAQAAMQVVDGSGTAVKSLKTGEYTVELMFTDSDAEFAYEQGLTVTGDAPQLTLELAYAVSDRTMEMVMGDKTLSAHFVEACSTQVPLTPGERNYFVFVPAEAGTFEYTVVGDVEAIGCYGTPYYITDVSIEPVENMTFTTSIRADQIGSGEGGTTVLVIGVDAGDQTSCVLSIQRTGDPAWSPEDVPYEVYQPTVELKQYTLPAGARLVDFDLTAASDAYPLVLAEDGTYHLNSADGPLVLVRLGVDNQYSACLKTMASKTGIRKYFYDADGNFLKRESYDDCLAQYTGKDDPNGKKMYDGVMDQEKGVYPLTEDLKYIIQSYGDHGGWWNLDSNTSLFRDDNGMPIPGINADIAWLFMCCYIGN